MNQYIRKKDNSISVFLISLIVCSIFSFITINFIDEFIKLISFNNLAILVTSVIFVFSLSGIMFSASRSVIGEYEQIIFSKIGKDLIVAGILIILSLIFLLFYFKLNSLQQMNLQYIAKFFLFFFTMLCGMGLVIFIVELFQILKMCTFSKNYEDKSIEEVNVLQDIKYYKKEMNKMFKNNNFGQIISIEFKSNKKESVNKYVLRFKKFSRLDEEFFKYIILFQPKDKYNMNLTFLRLDDDKNEFCIYFTLDKKLKLSKPLFQIFELTEEYFQYYFDYFYPKKI
jgi:hypothetical protein